MNRDRVFMMAIKSGCDVNDLFKALHLHGSDFHMASTPDFFGARARS